MFGNMGLESHPYYQKFVYQLRQRINYWSSQGAITPQELQLMCAMAQNPGQQTQGFIQGLSVRYPNGIDEQHMQEEIDNNFLPALRQAARQRLAMGSMGAMPINSMGLGMGGLGMGQQPIAPMATFSSGKTLAAGLFGETPVQQPQQPKPAAPVEEPPKPRQNQPWRCPEFDSDFKTSKFTVCNCVNIVYGKFNLHDGDSCIRMLVTDPRIRYTNDHDAIETYRPYFEKIKGDKKFVTIQYKQLMAIPVGREEITKLATEIAVTISKMDDNLIERLKAIVAIIRGTRYSFACSEAYNKLFCDEFDRHMQSGELTTSQNPKMILNRMNTIDAITSFVAKDIDKATVQGLESIPDYYKTLNQIVSDIVYDIGLNLTKKIVNPQKQLAAIGSYMRALPPVYTTDTDLKVKGTDDLVELWVMSNVQISGSKTDGAVAAGSALKAAIDELDKQFTVFWMWRTVVWTNYPASSSVNYSNTGECQPTVWSIQRPISDVTFFLTELMKAVEEGSDVAKRRATRSIFLEFEESTTELQFGWTVDAQLWLGCSKFWK